MVNYGNEFELPTGSITSWPGPGAGPSQFGGGPPYFLCPGVTSCE